ncbi:aspartyl/asparaginyl beta-hydroxylase isoform X2 [Bufo gargarizans]|uniref:aspartyl/asparaginyl beta-hydroxylase isoform X2 n=1 Tax=Bufo gargarizans TaxID=30331 RepID=UPI001CF20964|nr:aspartyl/asparaginyl beta-hydroxylase isoform X2 [Bufo gargarizans]
MSAEGMMEDPDQKHGGKNGKKEGLSGSSFFTWFMVIALLGVWTSVAVVWFDLVDYEEFIGKLGDYDADGDGDFDVDDAKVLLGLKERFVSKKTSEDIDETDSLPSDISDAELEEAINAIKDSLTPDNDVFDIEDALDDHETQDDAPSEFSLEDAVEPSVHESLRSEPEVNEEPEEEPVIEEPIIEEEVYAEEPVVEEQEIDDDTEQVLEREPAADDDDDDDDDVEEETLTQGDEQDPAEQQEPESVYEQAVEETETEFLNAPYTETEQPVDLDDVEYEAVEEAEEIPAHVEDEQPEVEVATEEEDPQDDNFEDNQEAELPTDEEESDIPEKSFMSVQVDFSVDPEVYETVYYDEETRPQTELEEEEPAELSDVPEADGEAVPKETEESATETLEDDDHEEEVNAHEHIEVEQNEIPENPVVDDRPSEKTEEHHAETSEGQQGEHAGGESASQEKKETAKKKKPKLLNKFDKTIKTELDAAEKLRKRGKVEDALKAFELLVTKYPQSPRARYGKAQSEDDVAEKVRSNDILLRAISSYEEVAGLPNVPADLVKVALRRKANRQQFLGRMRGSILTLQKLVQLYPEDLSLKNELGVGYLLLGENQQAKQVYEEVLLSDAKNGFAKVHYGFILKAENKIAESIPYLKEGLLSGEPGTDDGRFYFHLGDALQRVGDKEAYTWYEVGHKRGHFASVWQRSLYNVDGLKAQPWWTAKETGYSDLVKALEANWKVIRDEGLAVMDESKGLFLPEDENLREKGDWSQYTLWQQGRKNEKSCKAAPKTCALLERFPESTGCRRGQIKYSVMHPGTHVWPHTGPTNCRLRMHLGLVIPSQGCRIRCANDTRSWKEGKVLIFDDSFEHEVWQEAASYRLIFIVDAWHPELTQHQRRTLPAI